jgi:hypothetical protein
LFLFENESLEIKKLLFIIEEHILNDNSLKLVIQDRNKTILKLRKCAVEFIARVTNHYFTEMKIKELIFKNSNVGKEGVEIISYFIKHNHNLQFIDFGSSRIEEEYIQSILFCMGNLEGYFTIDLTGVQLSLGTIKLTKIIENSDFKKHFVLGKKVDVLASVSKAGKNKHEKNRRQGKKNV